MQENKAPTIVWNALKNTWKQVPQQKEVNPLDTLKEKQSLAKTMLQDGQEILEGRFMIVKKLGSGAFGEIYKGKYIQSNSTNFTTDISSFLCSDNSSTCSNFVEFRQTLLNLSKFDITLWAGFLDGLLWGDLLSIDFLLESCYLFEAQLFELVG